MSDSSMPAIKVLIKPLFDSAHHVASLSVLFTMKAPNVESGSALVSFPSLIKKTLVGREQKSVKATDGHGLLPLVLEDDGI